VHDQANDGHNEQQVNQRTCNMEGEKAQKPSRQEHDKENEKHSSPTIIRLIIRLPGFVQEIPPAARDLVTLDSTRPLFPCLCSFAHAIGQN
jgi:hypothetical protein